MTRAAMESTSKVSVTGALSSSALSTPMMCRLAAVKLLKVLVGGGHGEPPVGICKAAPP